MLRCSRKEKKKGTPHKRCVQINTRAMRERERARVGRGEMGEGGGRAGFMAQVAKTEEKKRMRAKREKKPIQHYSFCDK